MSGGRKLTPWAHPCGANSYDALKSTIYKFERAALQATPPAEPYSDDPSPSALEAAPATSSQIQLPNTQEKVFTRLLDLELHKMTEFYTAKEAELLEDLRQVVEDISRVEQEQEEADAVSLSHSRGGVSGASDSEGEEEEEEEGVDGQRATNKLLKGALATVFSNPKIYDAATRAGRKAQGRRGGSSGSAKSPGRRRAFSQVSAESDLLDLQEDEDDAAGGTEFTIQPGKAPHVHAERGTSPVKKSGGFSGVGRIRSRSTTAGGSPAIGARRRSRLGASVGEDEEDGDGLWGDRSDWAIDTKIMFKRRLASVFMVSR